MGRQICRSRAEKAKGGMGGQICRSRAENVRWVGNFAGAVYKRWVRVAPVGGCGWHRRPGRGQVWARAPAPRRAPACVRRRAPACASACAHARMRACAPACARPAGPRNFRHKLRRSIPEPGVGRPTRPSRRRHRGGKKYRDGKESKIISVLDMILDSFPGLTPRTHLHSSVIRAWPRMHLHSSVMHAWPRPHSWPCTHPRPQAAHTPAPLAAHTP